MSASRCAEHELTGEAEAIFDRAEAAGCTIHLPYDVVVAKEFAPNPPSLRTCNVHEVAADEMILDVGPAAVEALADVLKTCRTLVWNGPLGAFETPPFDAATVALARTAAALTKEGSLVSVAGGGDTVAALNQAGVAQDFTFVSTAGGAFLEWMEGRALPGVAALGTSMSATVKGTRRPLHLFETPVIVDQMPDAAASQRRAQAHASSTARRPNRAWISPISAAGIPTWKCCAGPVSRLSACWNG